jgi:hypothetical protein
MSRLRAIAASELTVAAVWLASLCGFAQQTVAPVSRATPPAAAEGSRSEEGPQSGRSGNPYNARWVALQARLAGAPALETAVLLGQAYDLRELVDQAPAIAAAIVKNAHTELERIRAIHQFVLRNTHYVALDFGIYSYQPYPVTQTYARRFGDCKDKASLMIALLREAGIDAQIVLVRTRRLGAVDPNAVSAAVFNHAVVYVPGYDLWLDGTAEYAGSRELPLEDQGAMALTVALDTFAGQKSLPLASSWLPRSYVQTLAGEAVRTQDLLLPALWTADEELHFALPAGAAVSALPPDTLLETPLGALSLRYERTGREVVVRTSIQFRQVRISPAEYGSFRDFCAQAERAYHREIRVRLRE